MVYWIAFTIGFLGSLHCVGMCGPIAFALPLNRSSGWTIWLGISSYNLGRIVSYSSMGLFFGLLGFGASLAGFQQTLSILVGLGIMLALIYSFSGIKKLNIAGPWTHFLGRLKGLIGKRFKDSRYSNLFLIGLLNGLLPCGLVYIGIASSSVLASPLKGALFMSFFGLGTLPLLIAVSLFKANINPLLRNRFKQVRPILLFIIASLFVLRGMNLGIPYISPEIQGNTVSSEVCINPDKR